MRLVPETPGGSITADAGLAVNAVAADGTAAPPSDVLTLAPATADLAPEDMEVAQTDAEADELLPAAATPSAVEAAATAIAAAAPDTGVDRLPYVPSPNGVWSVSPFTTWMSAGGMPISSATICANVVSWPCPWLMQDSRTTALPVGCTRSSHASAMPRPRMSMSLRGPAPTASVKNATPMPISSPRSRFSACSRRSSS